MNQKQSHSVCLKLQSTITPPSQYALECPYSTKYFVWNWTIACHNYNFRVYLSSEPSFHERSSYWSLLCHSRFLSATWYYCHPSSLYSLNHGLILSLQSLTVALSTFSSSSLLDYLALSHFQWQPRHTIQNKR